MSKPLNSQNLHEDSLTQAFMSGPGQDLVSKTLIQMASVDAFTKLFGAYKPQAVGKNTQPQEQRWADYPRMDWSIRQLPAINVFESESENKDSDNAFLNGAITVQVFWPPSFRRSDLSRVPAVFKAAIENFFASNYVQSMLDELSSIQRPMKVYGLNEFGKQLSWTPNVEGLMGDEAVPVTMMSIRYRIDLRAWYRALETMNRTKCDPFTESLKALEEISGTLFGVTDPETRHVSYELNTTFMVEGA
jgi:hypothetical protein